MKKTIAVSLGIFAIILNSVFTAALVTYQNKKDFRELISENKIAVDSSVVSVSSTTTQIKQITLDANLVSQHATQNDCWMTINNKVYNITAYFGKHPGGDKNLLLFCGRDATKAFEDQGHSAFAQQLLGEFLVGTIGSSVAGTNTTTKTSPTTSTPKPQTSSQPKKPSTKPVVVVPQTKPVETTVTLDSLVVATHATQNDCWMTINDKVYNITLYFGSHPGGDRRLLDYCGQDATAAFEGQGHSNFAHQLLADFLVGSIGVSISSNSSTQTTNTSTPTKPQKNDDDDD